MKGNQEPMLYTTNATVAALNHVPGFDPLKFLRRTISRKTGEDVMRLDLRYKKLWFRLACPTGRLKLNALRITEKMAIFEAKVYRDREDAEPLSSYVANCTLDATPGGLYVEAAQEEALDTRVWLKCGGYLVIEPTEAMTVIDVNSGKNEAKKAGEDTYYQVNLEAAEEVARQLRLRNLSGIIIVDFINMAEKERQKELLETLKNLTAGDPQHPRIVDMTPLGLVEITRKKSHPTLAEQFKR